MLNCVPVSRDGPWHYCELPSEVELFWPAPFSAPSIGWPVPLWTRPIVGLSWLPFAYLSYSFLSSFVDSTKTPSTAFHPAVGCLWSLRPGAMTGSIFPSDIPSQPRSHYPRSIYESFQRFNMNSGPNQRLRKNIVSNGANELKIPLLGAGIRIGNELG